MEESSTTSKSPSSNPENKGPNKRRKLSGHRACTACAKAKVKCSGGRPCERCKKLNMKLCVDVIPKRRKSKPSEMIRKAHLDQMALSHVSMLQQGLVPPSEDEKVPTRHAWVDPKVLQGRDSIVLQPLYGAQGGASTTGSDSTSASGSDTASGSHPGIPCTGYRTGSTFNPPGLFPSPSDATSPLLYDLVFNSMIATSHVPTMYIINTEGGDARHMGYYLRSRVAHLELQQGGMCVFVNHAACQIFGITPETLRDDTIKCMYPESWRARLVGIRNAISEKRVTMTMRAMYLQCLPSKDVQGRRLYARFHATELNRLFYGKNGSGVTAIVRQFVKIEPAEGLVVMPDPPELMQFLRCARKALRQRKQSTLGDKGANSGLNGSGQASSAFRNGRPGTPSGVKEDEDPPELSASADVLRQAAGVLLRKSGADDPGRLMRHGYSEEIPVASREKIPVSSTKEARQEDTRTFAPKQQLPLEEHGKGSVVVSSYIGIGDPKRGIGPSGGNGRTRSDSEGQREAKHAAEGLLMLAGRPLIPIVVIADIAGDSSRVVDRHLGLVPPSDIHRGPLHPASPTAESPPGESSEAAHHKDPRTAAAFPPLPTNEGLSSSISWKETTAAQTSRFNQSYRPDTSPATPQASPSNPHTFERGGWEVAAAAASGYDDSRSTRDGSPFLPPSPMFPTGPSDPWDNAFVEVFNDSSSVREEPIPLDKGPRLPSFAEPTFLINSFDDLDDYLGESMTDPDFGYPAM